MPQLLSVGFAVEVGRMAVLAGVYFAAAKVGLLSAIPPGYATAVWPPSGIALAALILYGARLWPGIWMGAALVNFGVQDSPFAAILIASGNTLEALTAAALVRQTLGSLREFERGADVFTFLVIAALSAMVAATVAAVPLLLVHGLTWEQLAWNWWTWWQGDAMGILLVTPLVLSWCAHEQLPWTPAKTGEAACLAGALVVTTHMIFSDVVAPHLPSIALSFLVLPFIMWATIRFRQREATTAIAAVCALTVHFTVQGRGPFAAESLNASLLLLLAFMSTVAATGLVLGAVVGERTHALASLNAALGKLKEQAITDPLTGLYNRRVLHNYLQREMARARRKGAPVAVLMLDLDHFKRVNDTHGHAAGDRVLKTVSALLERLVRTSDVACRYGGEEFALVLPESTVESALAKAEHIRSAVVHLGGALHGTTVSIGVAMFPEHATDPEALLHAADRALYEAKSAGRNRVILGASRTVPVTAANRT